MHGGVEPALNKALAFGVADGVFSLKDEMYSLQPAGLSLYTSIATDPTLFDIERKFLNEIGKSKVTEGFLNNLIAKIKN